MRRETLVIAHKELVDHWRDRRSLALSVVYSLMGPAVMWLAFVSGGGAAAGDPRMARVWPLMAAVFTLMAAFTGSMAPAMDTMAGERERRSLEPLILSASSRRAIIVGKWMALTLLSIASLVATMVAYRFVFSTPGDLSHLVSWVLGAPAWIALTMLAAASQLLVSTLCRSTKEANTYVSILVFGIMALAMWIAFTPTTAQGWSSLLPLVGQQQLLAAAFAAEAPTIGALGRLAVRSLLVATATLAAVLMILRVTATMFARDEAFHGD
jgi:sodium transport system permease protein